MDYNNAINGNYNDEAYEKRYELINEICDLVHGISFDDAARIFDEIANRQGV